MITIREGKINPLTKLRRKVLVQIENARPKLFTLALSLFPPLLPIHDLFILLRLLPPCWAPLQKMGRWDGVSSRHCGPPPPPAAPPPLLHLQHVDWGQTSINNLQVLRLLSRDLCRARRCLIEELLPGESINAAEEQRRHKKLRPSFLLLHNSIGKHHPKKPPKDW